MESGCDRSVKQFKKAVQRLDDVLAEAEIDVSRDAAIQRFEFCSELAWKSIQERARSEDLDCYSPKQCLQLGFKVCWNLSEVM